ncbi:DNA (cytosine-5)-methyltransferase 3A [Symbiodinium microadriaticum]|uniref:DNA (Cytosine-5)-methyltransferase 3A n=1 Tax=Symbiodinium microadriaticum TaxID=2951 RepID=A0A1Q9DDA1_SYMMI|nr:DNA (cytosine-5)-methyltransferase 3A [Symbiodinium microadriaticum]CAE7409333.1 DNMT3A [Symbiodinium microadriaticum]CAE7949533.1 DNMT3A [Symbiodinium sp. KB8]
MDGPVLVLSLFDGIGALLIALLALGASFAAMCWETDPDAAYVAVQLRRGHFTVILVAGGSPCQDVSPLHSGRPGLASARSQLFRAVPDIADQCRQVVKELHLSIPVFAMLENVAGCPPEFLQAASAALNGPPVQVSAASFGWTRRKRLFWCSNGHRSAQDVSQPKLPPNVTSQACAGGWRLGWQGKWPWPPSISFADDFKPRFDPVANAKASDDGPCFPVFSRAFQPPPDHGPRQDPVVMRRFREHGQWFPLFNYEEHALLWKKDQWRVPNSSERAQIMGIPPAALKWAPRTPRSETQAEQVRCSLIGNSFHVPSCMLALIMLFQLCPQASAIPPAAYVGLEKHIRQNAQVYWVDTQMRGRQLAYKVQAICKAMHPDVAAVAKAKAITLDEVRDGLAAGPFTKPQLDSLFGPGNWIPMRRFMLLQAIYTISPDFVAAACKFCIGLLQDLEDDLPMWAEPHVGTEDMKAAYRQLPNDPDEQTGLFIAFYDPNDHQVKYVHLRAHPFGLSAAVLNFNRVPCLSTAVVRRLAAVATCNYFDDFGVLDFVCARGSGVSFLREAHNLMGLVLDAVKQGPMATQRHFLGILLDLTAALDKQILRINLKVGLREALRADIQVMLDQDQCTAAEAAKLRGRLTWAACGMFGRCGRAGQAALVQRQYRDSDAKLSDELRASLRFFQSLVQVVEPRTVFLGPRALPPLIVYTDASWELQEKVLQCLQDRKTQIMPLEALAILQCFVVFGSRFTGRDILLFVDNQAVCAGVAKGACSSADCARIISACHLLWAKMGCRVWIEWIPSDDNPSDGLSRAGLQDPWTVSQNWWMADFPCVPWAQLQLLDLLLVPDVSEGEKGSETV